MIGKRNCLGCGTTKDTHAVNLGTNLMGYLCKKCMDEKYTRMKVYTATEIMAKDNEIDEWKNSIYKGEVMED